MRVGRQSCDLARLAGGNIHQAYCGQPRRMMPAIGCRIDAQSGQLVGYGIIIAADQLDDGDRAEVASLRHATVTLAQAVDTAERNLDGRAMSAELEEANGTVTYEITVVPKDGLPKNVTVDGKTRRLGG